MYRFEFLFSHDQDPQEKRVCGVYTGIYHQPVYFIVAKFIIIVDFMMYPDLLH